MFAMRLDNLFDFTSRSFRESLKGMNRSTAAEEKFHQVIEGHIDGIVSFAMQFSAKTYLKPQEAEVVLERLRLGAALVAGREDQYYWKRFGDIPEDRGVFPRVQIECMMAGNAFLEQCVGKTGLQELDDLIRQCGADIFLKVCEITRRKSNPFGCTRERDCSTDEEIPKIFFRPY